MSSTIGNRVRLSIFGESHGEAIGCVLDGLPAGEPLCMEEILRQMDRRAPGRDQTATTRRESDVPRLVSGVLNGRTTGAPLAMVIRNENQRSGDYQNLEILPRPGHADFTGHVRYNGYNDVRGGGHFSGRLTAPLVFAGAVCRQILRRRGVSVGGHILRIADAADEAFDPVNLSSQLLEELAARPFSLLRAKAEPAMRNAVEAARMAADSVGGVVECAVVGLPAGLGEPNFGGVENVLSSNLFGIPAVKGVEFGNGFAAASLFGSENNDPFEIEDGEVKTAKNDAGGVNGGITNGMPLIFRAAFKPTASVFKEQDSVDLENGVGRRLLIKGRHDPCVAVRAVPVVESVAYLTVLDLLLGAEKDKLNRGY